MDADRIIRALSALAQEHRLAAFRLLVQAGEDNNDNDKIHEGSRTVGVSSVLEGHERHFDDTCELGLNFLFPTR